MYTHYFKEETACVVFSDQSQAIYLEITSRRGSDHFRIYFK